MVSIAATGSAHASRQHGYHFPISFSNHLQQLFSIAHDEEREASLRFPLQNEEITQPAGPDMVIGFSTERLRFTTLYNTNLLLSI